MIQVRGSLGSPRDSPEFKPNEAFQRFRDSSFWSIARQSRPVSLIFHIGNSEGKKLLECVYAGMVRTGVTGCIVRGREVNICMYEN